MRDAKPWLSAAAEGIAVSAIKEMALRAAAFDDVAQLTWGLPSFRTPAPIREVLLGRLVDDLEIGKYSMPDGLLALRAAAATAHAAATGTQVDPDRHILVTAGNIEAVNSLLHVLLDPGDEVILTDPGFASHAQQIRLCGGRVVFWPLNKNSGWQLDPTSLASLITPRTKAIVLVSPNNPTGTIFREAALREVGRTALENDIFLLLDDAYVDFCFGHRADYFSLASAPELTERVVRLFSFSKGYAMSGFRVGYMVLPEPLRSEVLKVHDATMICAPRISQVAALAALQTEPTHLAEFETVLARRRDLICHRLDRLRHVFAYERPEGAYYMFPEIRVPHENSWSFCLEVLEKTHVTLTPGHAFGPSGEHHVRMAFCVEDETIEKAFDRMDNHFRR